MDRGFNILLQIVYIDSMVTLVDLALGLTELVNVNGSCSLDPVTNLLLLLTHGRHAHALL